MSKVQKSSGSIDSGRRSFLRGMAIAVPGTVLLSPCQQLAAAAPEHILKFYNTHTDEKLTVVYKEHGRYVPESLAAINHILRDFRTGDIYPMEPLLLDILHVLNNSVASRGIFEIISGYRSPKTNAMLRGRSSGVAKKSLHMQGKAVDVRLQGLTTARLCKAAIAMQCGGVGYYPKSNFVHVDLGRVRNWGG